MCFILRPIDKQMCQVCADRTIEHLVPNLFPINLNEQFVSQILIEMKELYAQDEVFLCECTM